MTSVTEKCQDIGDTSMLRRPQVGQDAVAMDQGVANEVEGRVRAWKALEPDACMAQLCREYEVSRQNGYKWVKRFRSEGLDGLEERSRRPHSSPLSTSGEMVPADYRTARKVRLGAQEAQTNSGQTAKGRKGAKTTNYRPHSGARRSGEKAAATTVAKVWTKALPIRR